MYSVSEQPHLRKLCLPFVQDYKQDKLPSDQPVQLLVKAQRIGLIS